MKTNYFVLIIFSAFLLSACSVGVNKDLLSGLKISNSGLSLNESYISRSHVRLTTSEYSLGDTVFLYIDGIEGFTEKDGKVYRGASMVISDVSGKNLLEASDLYQDGEIDGITKDESKITSLMLIVGDPMVSGGKYNWKSRVWDKNGKGEINAEVDFTVK